jgi:hypothetical protein
LEIENCLNPYTAAGVCSLYFTAALKLPIYGWTLSIASVSSEAILSSKKPRRLNTAPFPTVVHIQLTVPDSYFLNVNNG